MAVRRRRGRRRRLAGAARPGRSAGPARPGGAGQPRLDRGLRAVGGDRGQGARRHPPRPVGVRVTSSTSATASCRPPTPTCWPGSSSWCTHSTESAPSVGRRRLRLAGRGSAAARPKRRTTIQASQPRIRASRRRAGAPGPAAWEVPTTKVTKPSQPCLMPATKPAWSSSSLPVPASSSRLDAHRDRRHRRLRRQGALLRLQGLEVGLALGQLALESDDVAELGRPAEELPQLVDRLLRRS